MISFEDMRMSKIISCNAVQECEVYENRLDLKNKFIVDLGCGAAENTKMIASKGDNRTVIGMEIDEVQHRKNLDSSTAGNIEFIHAGAESLPLRNNTVDVIFMFKSMHHIPVELMEEGLREMYRVLKCGGYIYASEPILKGIFNDVLRLFHYETQVRFAAFDTIREFVKEGKYELADEIFFNTSIKFQNFDEFDYKIINASHSMHELSFDLRNTVRKKYEEYSNGSEFEFTVPIRVDLLRKPRIEI